MNIIHDPCEELSLTLRDSKFEFDCDVDPDLSFIDFVANIVHNFASDDELNATSVGSILDEHAPDYVDFISRINFVDLMQPTRLLPFIEQPPDLELKHCLLT